MKNLFKKTLLFAAAAFTFASCSNDTTEDVVLAPAVKVSLTATLDDTRSEFGDYNSTDNTYPTLWSGDEDWAIAMNDKYKKLSNENFTFSDDGKTANATLEFEADKTPSADSNSEYTLYAVSPYTAFSSYSQENLTFRYRINASQEPTTNSCDAAAQVLIAKSEAMPSLDSSFALQFKHATAYAKFSFTNVAEATVSGVSIKAEEGVNLAGRYQYSLEDGTITSVDELSTTINLTTSTTENLWVACAPVDVSGKKLTFTIITDKGNLVKEVTMPANCVFTAGRIATFTVNMDGITFPEATGESYELVTSLADITAGEYVITNGQYVLPNMEASQGSVSATLLSANAVLNGTTLTNVSDNVKWTLAGDNTEMSICSYTDATLYLNNGAKNNGVSVSTTKATWTFEALSNAGYTGFQMKDNTNSRYCEVYNDSNWRCYTSTTANNSKTEGGVLKLYKKVEAVDPTAPTLSLDKSSLEFETAGGSQTITATTTNYTGDITAVSDNAHFTTSVSDNVVTVTAPANEEAAAKTATITITAGTVSKTVTVSQAAQLAGTGEGTLESPYDVTRALAAIDANTGISGVYVKGIVTETAMTFNSNYNSLNYYISEDGTTASQLYVYSGKNLNNTNFTEDYANELHVGDEVVVYGNLTLYGSTYEFNYNNYIVSLTCNEDGGETPEPTPDPGTGDDKVILTEGFDDTTTKESSSAIGKTKFSNFNGDTAYAYTNEYGGLKLGSSKNVGYITSKSLDLSKAFTVTLDACRYKTNTSAIEVTVGDTTKTITNDQLEDTDSFKTFTLEFEAATASSTIKISTSSTGKRAQIDNVVVAYK